MKISKTDGEPATFYIKNRYLYTMVPYNDAVSLFTYLVMVGFAAGERTTL